MSYDDNELYEQFDRIRVYQRGERRAPHKPLLLLVAIARLQQGVKRLPFEVVSEALMPLLDSFAPPVRGKHEPQLPYWYLRFDELWEVDGAANLPLQKGGFPRLAGLRRTSGGLPEAIARRLVDDPGLCQGLVSLLLEKHFPVSLHVDILDAVGLSAEPLEPVDDRLESVKTRRKRDPRFREDVLRAYEYRCAFSGFRASLGPSYFGCEAAHVKWHSHEGPDSVANGIALEPTLHKLFDAGAWSLTDDRRILVSAHFTGNHETVARLRERHGQPLLEPIQGSPPKPEFIEWHREPELGGVFRQPALPLQE